MHFQCRHLNAPYVLESMYLLLESNVLICSCPSIYLIILYNLKYKKDQHNYVCILDCKEYTGKYWEVATESTTPVIYSYYFEIKDLHTSCQTVRRYGDPLQEQDLFLQQFYLHMNK
jgi:hypothetical protein